MHKYYKPHVEGHKRAVVVVLKLPNKPNTLKAEAAKKRMRELAELNSSTTKSNYKYRNQYRLF